VTACLERPNTISKYLKLC